jgi:hypothetical protein
MNTPTRIRWPRRKDKEQRQPHANRGAIPRQPGTLLLTLGLHDVVYNECRRENARLIVFATPARDSVNVRLYNLAIQYKSLRMPRVRWPGTHTILMPNSHAQSIDAWIHGYWGDRIDPHGWTPLI